MLFEGDFHPETKDKELKYRIAYEHKIYDFEKDASELEYSRKLLKEEFLTRIPIYSDLNLFQDKFLNNYNLINTNQAPFIFVLLAAKLKGIEHLKRLVSFAWEKLELEEKPDSDPTKTLISKLIPYTLQ